MIKLRHFILDQEVWWLLLKFVFWDSLSITFDDGLRSLLGVLSLVLALATGCWRYFVGVVAVHVLPIGFSLLFGVLTNYPRSTPIPNPNRRHNSWRRNRLRFDWCYRIWDDHLQVSARKDFAIFVSLFLFQRVALGDHHFILIHLPTSVHLLIYRHWTFPEGLSEEAGRAVFRWDIIVGNHNRFATLSGVYGCQRLRLRRIGVFLIVQILIWVFTASFLMHLLLIDSWWENIFLLYLYKV